MSTHLVSEQVGQFFIGPDRLEFTEYGSGDDWVVLLHGQLMPRTMMSPLARAMAGAGLHVVTLDLLGHGRSDRPEDPKEYSMTAFAEQVVALLDHLGVPRAVVGGTSLGANVSLEVAAIAPERVQGLLLEMPVLDNAVEAGILAFGSLLFVARYAPVAVHATRWATRLVPRRVAPLWAEVLLDTLGQRPGPMAAVVHGIFFGRVAPPSRLRRQIEAPALVVGHPGDPIHLSADAEMLADELPRGRFLAASSILEWRVRPERLDSEAVRFAREAWQEARPQRRRGRAGAR